MEVTIRITTMPTTKEIFPLHYQGWPISWIVICIPNTSVLPSHRPQTPVPTSPDHHLPLLGPVWRELLYIPCCRLLSHHRCVIRHIWTHLDWQKGLAQDQQEVYNVFTENSTTWFEEIQPLGLKNLCKFFIASHILNVSSLISNRIPKLISE